LVPVVSPEFRIRINDAEPISAVLKAWESADLHKGKAIDAERVACTIVAGEIRVWNSIAVIATALLPSPVFGIEAVGAALLPVASLFALLGDFLFLGTTLLNRLICGPLRNLLIAPRRLLLHGALLRIWLLLLLLSMLLWCGTRRLLLGVLLRGRLLLLSLDMLLRFGTLLLLLGVLLGSWLILLLLGVLLRGWFLLVLLRTLRGWFLLSLLAPLLAWLGLLFRPFLFLAFFFLLCRAESGSSEKQ
jgi:hypothetical protein